MKNDFQLGVSYMVYKLEKAFQEVDMDREKFGQKVVEIINEEQMGEDNG